MKKGFVTRLVTIVLVVVPTVFVATVIIKILIGATIAINISGIASIKNTHLYVNGKEVLSKNESTKSFALVNQVGKKSILIKTPGYEDYKTDVSVYLRGKHVVSVVAKAKTAADLAATLDSGYSLSDYTITSAKYFDNNSWLAFKLVSRTNSKDQPKSIMAYFHHNTGSWEVLNYGGGEYEFDVSNDNPAVPLPPKELSQEYFQ